MSLDIVNIRCKHLKALSYIISIFKIMLIVFESTTGCYHIQWWRLWFIDYYSVVLFKKNIVAVLYLQSIMYAT